MTMVMLPWVAQTAETSITQGGVDNYHWSFSVAKYGAQCSVDPYNTDAGNGVIVRLQHAYHWLPIPMTLIFRCSIARHRPASGGNSVYRDQWAAALATAFGTRRISTTWITRSTSGAERTSISIRSNPATTNCAILISRKPRKLKTWDPAAIRLGPVSCCWYFYWNLNSTTDNKSTHAGIDFLPWWLNEVAWSDAVSGTEIAGCIRYPRLSRLPTLRVLLQRRNRRWRPAYIATGGTQLTPARHTYIQNGGFSIEPLEPKPFRIPRMRAMVNATYPGTQFSITEWSAAFAASRIFLLRWAMPTLTGYSAASAPIWPRAGKLRCPRIRIIWR